MIQNALLPIIAIAMNTFRESMRNKVLASLIGFATLVAFLGVVLGQMSLHNEVRVAKDLSFFSSVIFGVAAAIYSSISLLHTEFERRTIYTILSKPIHRWQFLLGKYFGVLGVVGTLVLMLALVSYGMTYLAGGESPTLAAAYFTLFLQLAIVTAVALFFATVSSPLLSGLFTLGVFVAGNLTPQIEAARDYLSETNEDLGNIVAGIAQLLPDFHALNLSYQLTYDATVPTYYLLSASAYSATYSALVLLLAFALFSRKVLP